MVNNSFLKFKNDCMIYLFDNNIYHILLTYSSPSIISYSLQSIYSIYLSAIYHNLTLKEEGDYIGW